MNKTQKGLAIIVALLVFSIGGLGIWTNQTIAAEINIRVGHTLAPGHPYDLGAHKFKELLEARTGGKAKVDVFPSGTLGGERDMVEGTKLGTVDMVISEGTVAGAVAGVRKIFIFNMPFIFQNYDQFGKVIEGSIGEELNTLFKEKGFRNVGWMTAGFHQLINTKRPIYTPKDIVGLKMRMWESKGAQLGMQSMGATVIPMAFPEVFTALQQGVIDGLSNSYATFYLQKFYEVTKYVSVANWIIFPLAFMMGENFFQSLPPDIQGQVLQCGKEAAKYQRELYKESDTKYMNILKKETKLQFNNIDLNAFVTQVKPFRKDFAELIGSPDAMTFIEKVIAEAEKNK